jgi:hypothetical protein
VEIRTDIVYLKGVHQKQDFQLRWLNAEKKAAMAFPAK